MRKVLPFVLGAAGVIVFAAAGELLRTLAQLIGMEAMIGLFAAIFFFALFTGIFWCRFNRCD